MPESSAFHIPHSPVAAFGTIVLLCAFALAAFTASTSLVGAARGRRRLVESATNCLYAFAALMTLATSLIVYAFLTHDFTIKYVALNSDSTMPFWYKITAYWGGLDGSMMFWVFVLSVFAAIAVRVNRTRHADMIGYVVATVMVVQLFFLSILIYSKNPFATFLTQPPHDGKGLNPLLQTYWMVIHPPSLYVGYVAATIPFAFGIAALASGRLDTAWLKSVRVWVFVSWFFLSFGLMLGGRWAYEELGWGGYWAWDPVENAGLLPWFTATAFLHSLIIQEQRGMMKVWNVVLVITTFFLSIFGTFMTRSGIVQSVHAFGKDNELALLFILALSAILIVSFGLLLHRLPMLRSVGSFDSFYSREFAFLLNNWILLGCAFFVLFATMFPTLSEAVNGSRITVGPPFFNLWMVPTGLTLLFLAGAAPLLAWRRTTRERLFHQFLPPLAVASTTIALVALLLPRWRVRTPIFSEQLRVPVALIDFGIIAFTMASCAQEFWRGARVRRKQTGSDPITSLIGLVMSKRRTYGGYLIHCAIAVLFIGFAGKAVETQQDFAVKKADETFQVKQYHFRYLGLEKSEDDYKAAWTAGLVLSWNGEEKETMHPARWQYAKLPEQPTSEVAIAMDFPDDVYVVLTGFDDKTNVVSFRIFLNPLINWVWLSFALLAFGTVICLVPESVVKRLSPPRKTGVGRAAEAIMLVLVLGGVGFGMTRIARAEAPSQAEIDAPPAKPAAPVYADPMAQGHVGDDSAARWRPDSPTATKAMKDLVCLCGGCNREPLHDCKCSVAAEGRRQVLAMLAGRDLSTEEARQAAYQDVIAAFVGQYGEKVLIKPRSKLAWAIPYAAILGALALLWVVGRRWVRRGSLVKSARGEPPPGGEPDGPTARELEDLEAELDDELRDLD